MDLIKELDKLIESKIDRSKWQKWKFSDLVENINEKVVPKDSGLDHYIGLEHLDSGSLHIRRFGETKSLVGDKLKIYKGDIIFAKRNAYLKRVAIAQFDAVASAHSLVLRARSKNVLPEFLPFFLLSETLWKKAVEISVGSLSPTINWPIIAKQEFYLPPKDQQISIAELLWAQDANIEKKLLLLKDLDSLYSLYVDELFSERSSIGSRLILSKVADINKYSLKSNTDKNYTFQYMDIASIIEPKVLGQMERLTFGSAPSRARRIVNDHSIVLSLVRPYHKSFVFIEQAQNIVASTGTAVLNVKNGFSPSFIFHQFFSKKFLTYCETKMSGTNYPAISPTDLAEFEVIVPNSHETQIELAKKLNSIDKSILEAKFNIDSSQMLLQSLINKIF